MQPSIGLLMRQVSYHESFNASSRVPIVEKDVARRPMADFRDPCSPLQTGKKPRNRAIFKMRGCLRLLSRSSTVLPPKPEMSPAPLSSHQVMASPRP